MQDLQVTVGIKCGSLG